MFVLQGGADNDGKNNLHLVPYKSIEKKEISEKEDIYEVFHEILHTIYHISSTILLSVPYTFRM